MRITMLMVKIIMLVGIVLGLISIYLNSTEIVQKNKKLNFKACYRAIMSMFITAMLMYLFYEV